MQNKKSNIQISPSFLTLPAFYQFVCYADLKKQCARQFSPIKQGRLFALASSSILLLCKHPTPKVFHKTATRSSGVVLMTTFGYLLYYCFYSSILRPGVYSRLLPNMDWIHNITKEFGCFSM